MGAAMKEARATQNTTSEQVPERLNATLHEAAAFLNVSRRTVQDYQTKGLLRAVRFGRLRRYRWAELKRLEKNGVE